MKNARLKAAFVISLCLCMAPLAFADPSRLTGADFLEMDEAYRAGLVRGLLSSWDALGVAENFQSLLDKGMDCRLKQRRPLQTIDQLSSDFAHYLKEHPDQARERFALAFLLFMGACPKN
jgi:hypothetical protein